MSKDLKIDLGAGLTITDIQFNGSSSDKVLANVNLVLNRALILKGYAVFPSDDGGVFVGAPGRKYQDANGNDKRFNTIVAPMPSKQDEVSLDYQRQHDRVCDAIKEYWESKQPTVRPPRNSGSSDSDNESTPAGDAEDTDDLS